jgi:hypothetical protein
LRLVSEVLRAIEAGAFHPVIGWHCQTCPYQAWLFTIARNLLIHHLLRRWEGPDLEAAIGCGSS